MATTGALPRSSPEQQGVDSAAILGLMEAFEHASLELHSMMLVRHGHVVAEGWRAPYAAHIPQMLYSISKSFTATAVAIAEGDSLLALDDLVLSFFPEEAPAQVDENLARMRVRDLLTMTSGHEGDTTGPLWDAEDGNWVRAFLAQPVAHEPGTHFVYNSGASYMLSAIVQKLTGRPVVELLRERLFEPLGIGAASWETCPRGVNVGGWGLSLTTEAVARFGQLYLQGGVWQGQRLLPAGWTEQASSPLVRSEHPLGSGIAADWEQGYGFQLWRCRHDAYRGDGAFGQLCVVLPQQEAVLVMTALIDDMQRQLDLIWEHLLPGLRQAAPTERVTGPGALSDHLAGLVLSRPEGQRQAPLESEVVGRTYRFAQNALGLETLALEVDGEAIALVVEDRWGMHRVLCGRGRWLDGQTSYLQRRVWPALLPYEGWRVLASGAWTAPDTFAARLCFYDTPFTPTITCRFSDEQRVTVELSGRLGFSGPGWPSVEGRVV